VAAAFVGSWSAVLANRGPMASRILRHIVLVLLVLLIGRLWASSLFLFLVLGAVLVGFIAGMLLRGTPAVVVGAAPGVVVLAVLMRGTSSEGLMMLGVVFALLGGLVGVVGARTAVLTDAFRHPPPPVGPAINRGDSSGPAT
jgi:hypothetical protein